MIKQFKKFLVGVLVAASLSGCTMIISSENVKVERVSEFIDPVLIDLKKEE